MAVEISVGTRRLKIPPPEGFSAITSDMQPYADFAKQFVPPSNEQFALFLSDADVALAARGEIPQPRRWFYIQTTKALVHKFVSTAEFAEIKRAVKRQNEEILKEVESQMPDLFEKINKRIAADYQVDLNLSFNQALPLPPHHETERSLAYSMLLTYAVNDEHGRSSVFEVVVTATLVHVQGKVLFLYANAEKSGLDWCRSASRKWADTVIAANPSKGNIVFGENMSWRAVFDWRKVLWVAIAGIIIGGVTSALAYVLLKKNR